MSIAPLNGYRVSQTDTGFAERLAYVRWLRARGRHAPETDRELADVTKVGYQWLAKWKTRTDAPDSYDMREKFRRGLSLDGDWLYSGEGTAPEPELWKDWIAKRRHTPARSVAQQRKRRRG